MTFPLTSVVGGKSETTVNTTVANLMSKQYAINVHKSTTEGGIYTACVDLPLAAQSVTQLPRTGGPAMELVVLLGGAFVGAGALLRRRSA